MLCLSRKFYGDFFARIKTLTSLEVLNLEGMRMPAQQSLQMASVLSCFPHLRSLNLACNFIGDRDSPDGGRVSKALAKALKKLTALEELDMSDSDIRDGDIRLLAQGLQQKTSLVHLNLTGDDSEQYYTAHWFGSKGCKALGSMLKTLSSLKTLRLSYCNIDKSNIEVVKNLPKTVHEPPQHFLQSFDTLLTPQDVCVGAGSGHRATDPAGNGGLWWKQVGK